MRAGYGEIVKYGLIRDAGFFEWLEAEGRAVCDLEPAALTRAVMVSCRMKAEIVAADERETGDDRALLNFGHTFGHALEAETGFGDRLLHGEAVALGMVLAFDFAVRLGLASGQDAHRVRRHLAASGLPTTLAEIGLSGDAADRLLGHMGKDKKVRDGAITLILPRRIGDCFVMRDAPARPAAGVSVGSGLIAPPFVHEQGGAAFKRGLIVSHSAAAVELHLVPWQISDWLEPRPSCKAGSNPRLFNPEAASPCGIERGSRFCSPASCPAATGSRRPARSWSEHRRPALPV